MRTRFFLSILAVLILVTAGTIVLHDAFLRRVNLASIDQQVRNTATALIDSRLGKLRRIDFEEADRIISEELGENRMGKFFVIRNHQKEIIYESRGTDHIHFGDIPEDPQWVNIKTKDNFVRVLNLKLPQIPDRTLQVGIVVDNDFIDHDYFSLTSLAFGGLVLSLGLISSLFLTSFLLRPLAQLEDFLSRVAKESKTQPLIPSLPKTILSKQYSRDEFQRMAFVLNSLIEMVNRNYRFSRLWAYQMAHELKTPLAILNLETEKLQKKYSVSEPDIGGILVESSKISSTINSFLGWAELENSAQKTALFVLRLGSVAESVCKRFESAHPQRIELDMESDPVVLANPAHLEQVITNLLSNALNYSDSKKPVTIHVSKRAISFIDGGQGIPASVLNRIGEPFNRGDMTAGHVKGSGLGLAWVNSICKKYSWQMDVIPSGEGSKVVIGFPPEEEISSGLHS